MAAEKLTTTVPTNRTSSLLIRPETRSVGSRTLQSHATALHMSVSQSVPPSCHWAPPWLKPDSGYGQENLLFVTRHSFRREDGSVVLQFTGLIWKHIGEWRYSSTHS